MNSDTSAIPWLTGYILFAFGDYKLVRSFGLSNGGGVPRQSVMTHLATLTGPQSLWKAHFSTTRTKNQLDIIPIPLFRCQPE